MSADDIGRMAELYAALARAIAASNAVEKDARNTHQGYKYASAEGLIEEARAALSAQGLACVPKRVRTVPLAGGAVSAGGKANWYFADVEIEYHVTHGGGGVVVCEASTPAIVDNGRPQDKAVATAQTYSLGYFLRALLLLPRVDEGTDVDRRDDRAADRDDRTRPQPPQRQQQQSPPRDAELVAESATPTVDPKWAAELSALVLALDLATTVDELRTLPSRINAFPTAARDDAWRRLRNVLYPGRKAQLEAVGAHAVRDAVTP